MKPIQTENILILTETLSFWRRIGVFLLIAAAASFIFAYFGAIYFGGDNFVSTITYAVIAFFFGIGLLVPAVTLVTSPDRKLEINHATGKMRLTEKLFRTVCEEFSFADVARIEMNQIGGENDSAYLPQIVFQNGKTLTLPSDNAGDEAKQTELLEQVKNLLKNNCLPSAFEK